MLVAKENEVETITKPVIRITLTPEEAKTLGYNLYNHICYLNSCLTSPYNSGQETKENIKFLKKLIGGLHALIDTPF
jgi:hypothetical protein